MELYRLLSFSTLPGEDTGRSREFRRVAADGSTNAHGSTLVPRPLRGGVRVKHATFGTDIDGARILVVYNSSNQLVLHQSCGEEVGSGVEGQFTLRTLPWFADSDKAICCLSLSENGKTLAVLCHDGSVFIVPVAKLLSLPTQRLYQAPLTKSGFPSMTGLLLKRPPASAKSKQPPKDTKWTNLDAMKLPLPSFQGLNREVIDGKVTPSAIAWVSSSELALFLPSGICNIINAVSCDVIWTGLAGDVQGGRWRDEPPPSSGGGGSLFRSRVPSRQSQRTTTSADAGSAGGSIHGIGMLGDVESGGSARVGDLPLTGGTDTSTPSAVRLTPEIVHNFLVWTETTVFECVSSATGPASSCLQYCLAHLESPRYPRPDLALRACALAVGVAVGSLPSDYNPYLLSDGVISGNSGASGVSDDPPAVTVPPAHVPVLCDLFVQCYAICRANFAWNPAVFRSSGACGVDKAAAAAAGGSGEQPSARRDGPAASVLEPHRYRPRRAPCGVIAGVDAHKFLMNNEQYGAERAYTWLLQFGLVFEAVLVGHARNLMSSVLSAVFTQLGPSALNSKCIDFLTSRGHATMLMTFKGGLFARMLPPSLYVQLLCSVRSQLLSSALEVTALLPLIDNQTLRKLIDTLHPLSSVGVRPIAHTRNTAELFLSAFLRLIEHGSGDGVNPERYASLRPDGSGGGKPAPPPNADSSDAESEITLGQAPVADHEELHDCVRALRTVYNAATILTHCIHYKCYSAAALVCEFEGDHLSAFQCKLLHCVQHSHHDQEGAGAGGAMTASKCVAVFTDALKQVGRLPGYSDSIASNYVCEVLCFWARHKFPLDVLLPSLSTALNTFGVAVAKPLLGNVLPEYCLGPGDSKGPLGTVAALLAHDTESCLRSLQLPVSLLRAAVETIAAQSRADKGTIAHDLLNQLAQKLANLSATLDGPQLIPSYSPIVTSSLSSAGAAGGAGTQSEAGTHVALVFSCGHSFKAADFHDVVLPQYRASLHRLGPVLPQTVLLCDSMYAEVESAGSAAACPHCVVQTLTQLVQSAQAVANSKHAASLPHGAEDRGPDDEFSLTASAAGHTAVFSAATTLDGAGVMVAPLTRLKLK